MTYHFILYCPDLSRALHTTLMFNDILPNLVGTVSHPELSIS